MVVAAFVGASLPWLGCAAVIGIDVPEVWVDVDGGNGDDSRGGGTEGSAADETGADVSTSFDRYGPWDAPLDAPTTMDAPADSTTGAPGDATMDALSDAMTKDAGQDACATGQCTPAASPCFVGALSACGAQCVATSSHRSASTPCSTSSIANGFCDGNGTCLPPGSSCTPDSGATLASDALNCGACGHSCLGGTCSAGQCQPILLGMTAYGRLNEKGLAVDANNVYLTENLIPTSSAAYVESCPLSGCTGPGTTPTATIIFTDPLTSPALGPIIVDKGAGYLYFGDTDNGVVYATKTDGTVAWSTPNHAVYSPYGFVTDATKLYVAGSGGLFFFNKTSGGTPQVIDSTLGTYQYREAAIDSNSVWSVSYSPSSTPPYFDVMRCPLMGPFPEQCTRWDWSSAQPGPFDIQLLGAASVPFIRIAGQGWGVWVCHDNTDCSIGSAIPINTTSQTPITGDSNYLYYTVSTAWYRCPAVAAACTPEARGPTNDFVEALTNDSQWLYWVGNTGRIFKVAK
jgi:hypothetical protein